MSNNAAEWFAERERRERMSVEAKLLDAWNEGYSGKDAEPVKIEHRDPNERARALLMQETAEQAARDAVASLGLIIAVDFDGTLCEQAWPEIGAPKWRVIQAVKAEQRRGARLILWTNRVGDRLQEAVEWCGARGLHFDAVNENLPETIERYGGDSRKVTADVYIDDKALRTSTLERRLRAADPWNNETETEKEEPRMTNKEWLMNEGGSLTGAEIMDLAEDWWTRENGDPVPGDFLERWLVAEHTAPPETTVTVTVSATYILHGMNADEVIERGTADRIADMVQKHVKEQAWPAGWEGTAPDLITTDRVQVFPTTPGRAE